METVPFGFREVGPDEKRALVGDVFAGVAARYDLMNDLMSGGLHRAWRHDAMQRMTARDAARTLDLAGGTGDMAFRIRRRFGNARVTVADASAEMLEEGRRRALDRGLLDEPRWLCADAAALPFEDGEFSQVVCAFGLRNFSELGRSLREVRRVLYPGGRFLALEFAPHPRCLDSLYGAYLFQVVPWIGDLVTGRRDAYTYLAESIRRFLTPEALMAEFRDAALGAVRATRYAGGIACLYSARRT